MEQQKKRAKELIKSEQFAHAKMIMLELARNGYNNAKFWSKLGDISIHLNELHDAQKYYKKSMLYDPHNINIYIKYSNLMLRRFGDTTSAESIYFKALKVVPNNDELWYNFGKSLFTLGKYFQSEECYLNCQIERG
eukprot:760885_1